MRILFYYFLFLPIFTIAQNDYGWWNNKHNWDDVTSWQDYMVYSPRYFGPNALPILDATKGAMKLKGELETSLLAQLISGDNTYAFFERGGVPFGKRVFIEVYGVGLEYYNLDSTKRDERFARDEDAKGLIGGDIYFSTYLQLIEESDKLPGVGLRAAIRTASGLHLKNARYTDAPGYFFDVSVGKFIVKNENFNLRLFTMLGFYAWQTNDVNALQNDAIMFSLGADSRYGNWFWKTDFSGFKGYLNNGDFPLAFRNELGFENQQFSLGLISNFGFKDNLYNTFGIRFIEKINWLKMD